MTASKRPFCRRNRAKFGPVLAAALLAVAPARAFERVTVTSERVLVDPITGLALAGYDPVAYFVDGRPRRGKPAHEYAWNGAVWRFVNIGNREAFRHAPEIYAPQFGGYDALAVSRGHAAHGSPLIWDIHEDRLYFFASPVSRAAWRKHPKRLTKKGAESWPGVENRLAR